jgi:DNA repair ATPase RecN
LFSQPPNTRLIILIFLFRNIEKIHEQLQDHNGALIAQCNNILDANAKEFAAMKKQVDALKAVASAYHDQIETLMAERDSWREQFTSLQLQEHFKLQSTLFYMERMTSMEKKHADEIRTMHELLKKAHENKRQKT